MFTANINSRFNKTSAQLALFLVLVIASSANLANAQNVQPMVYELAPIGNKSSTDLRIENTKSSAITYELSAVKVSHDEFGEETRTPAEDDFLIYPPQTLIMPGKTQIVKVKYIGEPLLEQSQTYRVLVNELPVDLSGGESSGVNVAINFSTLCNVTPAGSSAALNVTELKAGEQDAKWSITIENSGNRFSRLSETIVEVTNKNDPSQKQIFKNEYIGDIFQKNLVAPKSKLTLQMPAIEGFDVENTQITITESS